MKLKLSDAAKLDKCHDEHNERFESPRGHVIGYGHVCGKKRGHEGRHECAFCDCKW